MAEHVELSVTCTRDQVCAKFKQMWVDFGKHADWQPYDKFKLIISTMEEPEVVEPAPSPESLVADYTRGFPAAAVNPIGG